MNAVDSIATSGPPGSDGLTISASSFGDVDFSTRVRAAHTAGFGGIGLRFQDYRIAGECGLTSSQMSALLSDHGLQVQELELQYDWVTAHDGSRSETDSEIEATFAAAVALAARQVNLSLFTEHLSSRIVESFASLCDLYATENIDVALEFMPYSALTSLDSAWHVVREAQRPNGHVLFDSWHFFRSGGRNEDVLAIPSENIASVQLSDIAAEPWPDAKTEARTSRLLPGAGVGDLDGLLATLAQVNYAGPFAVEVPSLELRGRGPEASARAMYAATIATLTRAESNSTTADAGRLGHE